MKNTLLTLAICMLAAAYGCSLIPSAPSKSAPAAVVVPNVGTSWTFQNTYLDDSGKVAKTDTSTRTVIATNMFYQGDSDVVMTVETYSSSKNADTIYLRYLSTGDISRLSWPLIAPHLAAEWLTIPYHTQRTNTYAWAGYFSLLGYTFDTISFSASYTDVVSDTVAGVVYDASIVTTNTWQNMTGSSKDSLIVTTQTNSFIPSNGIFGNHNVTASTINGKQILREQQVLIAVKVN